MRVFLDTNILLDVLMNRPGLVADSEAVILNCAAAGHPMFIAWHGLATAYYLLKRGRTEAEAMTKTVLPSGLKKNAIFRHVLRNTYPTTLMEKGVQMRQLKRYLARRINKPELPALFTYHRFVYAPQPKLS